MPGTDDTGSAQRRFLFVLGSSRTEGNTEALVRHAAARLPTEVEQRWLRLSDLPLPAFEDLRHAGGPGHAEPAGNERLLLDATVEATDLVIASPLYWYSVSAITKLYLDYWSPWLRVPGVGFRARMRGRTMWAVTVTSEEDPTVKTDPLLGTLKLTADYMGMRWGGELVGYGNRPGDVLSDTKALAEAEDFFGLSR